MPDDDTVSRTAALLQLTDDQETLREHFGTFFAKESTPEHVRKAEPLGFDRALWEKLRATGVPELGLAGGASLADLAVVAEEWGRRLAPVPFVESIVAARLLERVDACPPEVADGSVIPTVALRPAVDGVARLVPAGAVAEVLVALDGDELVCVRTSGDALPPARTTTGCAAVADRRVVGGGRVVLARGADARDAFETALDEWRLLTAAALVGVGAGALDLGVDYAKTRWQFGAPIGSYQAVQQRLADVATALDGARLLVRDAVAADGAARRAKASMAFLFAAESAEAVAGTSLHVHGGYGFMLEYDVQLFFRRAKAWPLVLGDPDTEWAVLADRLDAVDWFADDGPVTGWRAEVRSFFEQHMTPDVRERVYRTGTVHDWDLHRAMASASLLAAGWSKEEWGEYGGQGRDAFDLMTLSEEIYRFAVPHDGAGTAELVAHTLAICGTEQQKREIVPAFLRGEILICLGYSEPESGSDVAAAQCRAVRDGDHWVINGQKMFTTLAHESAYVFLLTRTNPDVPKHKGLTMFLVPMDTPGIEISPVQTLGGERTNITYYTDVRVPDSCRVGEVDGGWRVMQVALAFERQPAAQGEMGRMLRQAVAWARSTTRNGRRVIDDPVARARLARVAVEQRVGYLLGLRMTEITAAGGLPIVEGSMAKLFGSEAFVRATSSILGLTGPDGVLQHGEPDAPADGWIEHAFRHSQVMTIYAGTSEIQRSIIAERGLGLPRAR